MPTVIYDRHPFILAVYQMAKIDRENSGVHIVEKLIDGDVLGIVPGFYPSLKSGCPERIVTFFAVAKDSAIPFQLRNGMKIGDQIDKLGFKPKFLIDCRIIREPEAQSCEQTITIYLAS